MAQADRFGTKLGGHHSWRCFCIHRVNRVNSRSALSTIAADYSGYCKFFLVGPNATTINNMWTC